MPKLDIKWYQQAFQKRCKNEIVAKLPFHDQKTIKRVSCISEYAENIQKRMYKMEHKWMVDKLFIVDQPKITETIRSTLVDWLVLLHINFKLLPETLFLAVNILDRYLS